MADSNLSGDDLVCDGEAISSSIEIRQHRGLFPKQNISPTKSLTDATQDSRLHSMDRDSSKNAMKSLDPRYESGYGSMISAASSLSPPTSIKGGCKSEPSDKKPIQCTEEDLPDLTSKLSKLDLVTEKDEGIESMTSLQLCSGKNDLEFEDDFELEDVFTEEDGDGDTILHNTILNEMISVAVCLIKICPKVSLLNTPNQLFQTPLHLAVLTNLAEVVRNLVEKGADVLVRDQQGNTPLHIACRTGNKDIIEYIVESAKSDSKCLHKLFTLKNSEGLTCLHIAAEKKEYIVMGYLMANGADVNIGDAKSGRTVLHYAVERRDMDTVKVLLTHKNIDIDCVTFKGESPLVIAYWRNYQDIVKKLKSKGAYFSFDLVYEWDEEEV